MEKQEIISRFKKSEKDRGSASVQVALLTTKIKELSKHFQIHKKDFHSMTGLIKMVSRRKKLLSYVKRKNQQSYLKLIKDLSLRK